MVKILRNSITITLWTWIFCLVFGTIKNTKYSNPQVLTKFSSKPIFESELSTALKAILVLIFNYQEFINYLILNRFTLSCSAMMLMMNELAFCF